MKRLGRFLTVAVVACSVAAGQAVTETPSPTSSVPLPVPTATPAPSPSSQAPVPTTSTPEPSPLPSPSPLPTNEPTPSPTSTPSPTPTPTSTLAPTPTPSPTSAPTPTPAPTPNTTAPSPTTITPIPTPVPTSATPQPTQTPPPTSPPAPFPTPSPPAPTTPAPTTPAPTSPAPTTPAPTPTPTLPTPTPSLPTPTPITPDPTPTPSPTPTTPPPTSNPPDTPSPSPTRPGSPLPTGQPTPTPTPSVNPPGTRPPIPDPDSPSPPTADPQPTPSPITTKPATTEAPASPAPPSRVPIGPTPPSPPIPPTAAPSSTSKSPGSSPSPSSDDRPSPGPAPNNGNSNNDKNPSPPPIPASSPSETPAPTARPYERGDQIIIIQTPTAAPDSGASGHGDAQVVVVNPSDSPAALVGGNEKTGGNKDSNNVPGRTVYRFLQYLTSVMALVTCLILIVQHLLIPSSSAAASWEFVLLVGYIQRMASLSHVVARRVPYFLWDYVDAFSWTVFVPFHNSTAAMARRRLDQVVVVLDGIVAFADRIGVKEYNLLNRGVAGILVVAGVVALVVGVAWVLRIRSKRAAEQTLDSPDSFSVTAYKKRGWSALQGPGLPMLAWLLAVYPMAMLASFEISMEIRAHEVSAAPLTVALLVLVFGIGVLYTVQVITVIKKTSEGETDEFAGENSFHTQKWTFTVFVVVQIVSGITVGAVRSPVAQLVVLMVLVVAFHGFAWQWIRSTTQPSSTKWIILALGLVQVVNLGLSFAFVSSLNAASITEGSHSVAVAYIILNSVVILAVFARVFGLTCQQLGMLWDERQRDSKTTRIVTDNSASFVPIVSPPQ